MVDVAGDRLDRLHLTQEMQFDFVILDGMLPQPDGLQVLTGLAILGNRDRPVNVDGRESKL